VDLIFFAGYLLVGIISFYNSNSCLKGPGNTPNSLFLFFFKMLGKERFKGLHVFGSLTEIIARRSQAYSFLSGDQKKNEESLCSTPFSSFGRHHYSLSRTELLSHPPPCHLFVKNIDVAKRTE